MDDFPPALSSNNAAVMMMDAGTGVVSSDALRTTTSSHLQHHHQHHQHPTTVHLTPSNELTNLDNNGNAINNSDSSLNITGNIELPEQNLAYPSTAGQQLDHSEKEQVRWPVLQPSPSSALAPPSATSSSSSSVPQSTRCIEAQQIREINYPKPESIDSPSEAAAGALTNEDLEARHAENTATSLGQDPLKFLIQRELSAQKRKSNSSDLMDLNDVDESSLYEQLSQEEAFRDFELTCSAKDIAKVLETFNAILEDGLVDPNNSHHFNDLTNTVEGDAGENCMKIVDNFANLLVAGENDDEELLIVVDNSDQSLLPETKQLQQQQNRDNFRNPTTSQQSMEEDEQDSLTQTTLEDEDYYYPDDTEGYESDRPMVRASMRRLRPVQLLPMPSNAVMSSYTIPESPCPSPGHRSSPESPIPACSSGTNNNNYNNTDSTSTAVPGSPIITNNNCILVTSLVNNINVNNTDPAVGGSGDLSEFRVVNEVNNPIYSELTAHSQVTRVASSGSSQTALASPGLVGASVTSATSGACNPNLTGGGHIGSVPPAEIPSSSSNNRQTNGGTPGGHSSASSTAGSSNNASTQSTPARSTGNNRTTTQASASTTTTAGATNNAAAREIRPLRWPHRLSSVLAVIGCTLGLTNICRFSLLSVEYGANFVLQFLFLSLVFGIPLLTFHMSIGQYLSAGSIDMWKISPIFKGIGIGLVISQAVIGIYTAVGVSWVFIYFRDSFITRYDQYRWGKCFREYRDCNFSWSNTSNFGETVPDYFNGVVLQRGTVDFSNPNITSGLKFTVAFNLAVVWMLIFVFLSKGLKSYGKAIHGLILVPLAGLLILASKVVGLVPTDEGNVLFVHTAWSNFFFNSQTWLVAAREAFFTWGLLGACVMQITSHNRYGHNLKSDASVVVLITTFVLLLGAFLGNACYAVITSNHYNYYPSSFETARSSQFLVHSTSDMHPDTYLYNHISFLMGVRILPPELTHGGRKSGYQALRLATELFPTTMAMLSGTGLSPFWTVLFYGILIMFGIAQQVAIWHCIIRGVIAIKPKVLRAWEITITVCVCATGFVLGLPLATELGIFIEYFMDYVVGSGWWIIVLYLLELVAVFIVRGAPYCGENIVTVLMTGPGKLMAVLGPLLSFVWNVILPVAMLVLSIASFKSGNIRELYDWNPNHGYEFWPSWTRELGSFMQLLPILAVPFVAIVQSCRYLSTGPPDLFERMQRLYRPTSRGLLNRPSTPPLSGNNSSSDFNASGGARNEDPPPKYTPPPSYSTATGAKIAKFLRSSIRRSMRRFGGPSAGSSSTADLPPPPNYASVILEINAQQLQQQSLCNNNSSSSNPVINNAHSMSTALAPILLNPSTPVSRDTSADSKPETVQPSSQTLGKSLAETKERASLRRIASDITPRDIARLLRASFRRSASPERSQSASTEAHPNTLSYPSQQQPGGGGSPPRHAALSIEVDFLRIPSSSDVHLSFSENYVLSDGSQSLSENTTSASGRNGRGNVHIRSVSSGGTLMGGQRNSMAGSQTTLISHSSSQNDLSHLIDSSTNHANPALDFRLRGIVNPSFQFSHHSVHTLRNGHNSLNQSDA